MGKEKSLLGKVGEGEDRRKLRRDREREQSEFESSRQNILGARRPLKPGPGWPSQGNRRLGESHCPPTLAQKLEPSIQRG
jgi:hypothetical protein